MDIFVLLKYKPQDYKILLVSGKTLRKGFIYIFNYTELQKVKRYLIKKFKKGFIWELKLLVLYFILFIPKKDKKFRLYVDYRKLNNQKYSGLRYQIFKRYIT